MTDPSSLKVTELREELSNRDLPTKGKKAELVARLIEALENEKTSTNEEPKPDLENISEQETKEPLGNAEIKNAEALNKSEQENIKEQAESTAEEAAKPIAEKTTKEQIKQTAEEPIKESEAKKEPATQPEENKIGETNGEDEKVSEKTRGKSLDTIEIVKEDKSSKNSTVEKLNKQHTKEKQAKVEDKEKESIKESAEAPTDTSVKKEIHAPESMEVDAERGLKRKISEEPKHSAEEKRSKVEDKNDQTNDSSAILVKGFVRPLILRQAQELFAKYGNIKRFWMDAIKTHCYVIYETIEDAQNANSQVNGIIFPTDTGRKLTVESVTPQQAESLIEYEQSAAEQRLRINWEEMVLKVKSGEEIPSSPASEQRKSRPMGIGQITRQLAQAASSSEKLTPVQSEKVWEEKPAVSLDDLFRKTKTIPHLYYLPVSEEEATARANQLKSLS